MGSEIMRIIPSDSSVIERIRHRDQVELARIYKKTYPMVLQHITRNSGSKEDAQDIFQDAFYILIKKTEDVTFELQVEVSTFLMGIAKNLWLKKLSRNGAEIRAEQKEIAEEEVNLEEQEELKLQKVRHLNFHLTALGEPCKTILVSYYYLKKTMQEIADEFRYTNADNAKNQKYKCLQRLKKLISGKSE